MHLRAIAGQVAGVITFLAYLPYLFATINGETKPNRATWFLLVVIGSMLASSYFALGAETTIWVPVGYVIGPTIIAMLSIKYGEGGWSPFDRWCLLAALSTGVLWWIFDAPLTALLLNLLMDFISLLPTIKKGYLRPWTEDPFSWTMWFFGSVLNLLAVERWTFGIAIYPIYMAIGNGLIVALIYRKSLRHMTK